MKNRNGGSKNLPDNNKRESAKIAPSVVVIQENGVPAAPDGGWGWVIIIISFVCCAVVDGMCSVFGVLLPGLVYYFEESTAKTALAGSVLAGGFLLSGIVSMLSRNYYNLECLAL